MADVLNSDDFKDAQLLTGERGLNKRVTWVHILEITKYVQESVNGGELILSTGVGFYTKRDALNFFKDLLKKNIAGVCFELGTYISEVPPEIIQMAEDNDCPLIIFPKVVRFVDITRNLITKIINSADQSLDLEKRRWGKNEWMVAWMKEELEEESIYRFLGQSKKSINKTNFFVIILDVFLKEHRNPKINQDEHLFNITTIARNFFQQRNFIMYAFKLDSLLVWIVFDLGKSDTWKIKVKSFFDNLTAYNKILPKNMHITMGCGIRTNNILNVPKSYKTALETLRICRRIGITQPFYEDLHAYRILSLIDLPGKKEQLKNYVKDYLCPIAEFDYKYSGDLITTLKVFYQCNGSKQQAAELLGVSRQTIYYRMQKIEDLIGDNLLTYDKRLAVEFALFTAESLFGKDNIQRKILESFPDYQIEKM